MRCASQVPRKRQQKPSSSRLSNEYSEPFDYLMLNTTSFKSGHHSATLTLPMNRLRKLQAAIKVSKDDSAYYSSSCQSSSQSTPKIYNNIWETSLESSRDKEETDLNCQSPTLSASELAKPMTALPVHAKVVAPPPPTTLLTTTSTSEESSETDQDSSAASSPPLMLNTLNVKHSTPILLNKKYSKSTTMPVVSEYESVRDSLIKDYEKRLDLQNSFKSTITAFDVLSDR